MSPRSHASHPLFRSRAAAALVALLALVFTGLSVSQAHAAAPAGTYTGESTAYNGATVTFNVDASGNVSGFSTTSYCYDPMSGAEVPLHWADMPSTPTNAAGYFSAEWEIEEDVQFSVSGTINADGTASGSGVAGMNWGGQVLCGGHEFDWDASTEVGGKDPDPVYDPTASVTPSELTESEFADSGVVIEGQDFAPNTDVELAINGSAITVKESQASGDVIFEYSSDLLGAGSHTAVLTSGDLSATASFTVNADAPVYDPQVVVSPKTMTESEVTENGISITATGFPANEEIFLTVVENESGGIVVTDDDGSVAVTGWMIGDTSPGERTLSARVGEVFATDTFMVTADAPVYNPQMSVSPTSLTLSEAQEDGVEVSITGFPANTQIAVGLEETQSGDVMETDDDGNLFIEGYALGGLGVGEYTLVANYEDLTASAVVTVTEDDDPVYDPQASASPSSVTESELADPGVTITGWGFPADASVSLTVAGEAAGSRSADANGDVAIDFTSDLLGAGSHAVVLASGDLSATTSFTVTEDPIVYNPQASVSPSTLTESEFADSGVTVTGTDFPANQVVNLTVDGVEGGSQTADADGTVAIGYITDALAPGTYTVQLANGDLTADSSFTVEADPAPVYDPQISLSTTEVTETAFANDGVDVSGTGFPADATVTLIVADQEVTTGDSDADGTIAFTFWGENFEPGQYTVRLVADAEGADVQATFTVIADEQDEDPAPETIPAAELSPEDLDPALQGAVEIPAGAAPGDRIVLTVTGVDPGTEVGVWIFSDPTYLGTHTVDGNGQVTVILPAGLAEGTHSISVWTEAGLVGWDTIVVSADGDPVVTDPEDGTGGTGDELALTGGTVAAGTLVGGVLLLVIGFGLVVLARTRRSITA